MAKYQLTKEATTDLYNIWNYTYTAWSEVQADKYYSQLVSAFSYIAKKDGMVGKEYDEILIVRILHERMDYKSRLQ